MYVHNVVLLMFISIPQTFFSVAVCLYMYSICNSLWIIFLLSPEGPVDIESTYGLPFHLSFFQHLSSLLVLEGPLPILLQYLSEAQSLNPVHQYHTWEHPTPQYNHWSSQGHICGLCCEGLQVLQEDGLELLVWGSDCVAELQTGSLGSQISSW